jgi:predicted RNase H-like nuclease (RuvC/YqgF family)
MMTPHLQLVVEIIRGAADDVTFMCKHTEGNKNKARFLREGANHIEVREEHYESAKAMVRRLQAENEQLQAEVSRLAAIVESRG